MSTPRSLGRYLLAGGVLAVLVGAAMASAVGHALYAKLPAIALTGAPSITGDTVIGAFLIGFFTLVIVAPATRREVRSGRVRGGRKLALPGWLARRPVVAAIAGGLVSAVFVGGGAVAVIAALGASPMPSHTFFVFKIAFAGVWGGLAAVLVAALAAACERSRRADPGRVGPPPRPVPRSAAVSDDGDHRRRSLPAAVSPAPRYRGRPRDHRPARRYCRVRARASGQRDTSTRRGRPAQRARGTRPVRGQAPALRARRCRFARGFDRQRDRAPDLGARAERVDRLHQCEWRGALDRRRCRARRLAARAQGARRQPARAVHGAAVRRGAALASL